MSYGPKRPLPRKAGERPPKDQRVYCRDCQYFKSWLIDSKELCNAPGNKIDTYLAPDADFLLPPSVRNLYNDCPLYESDCEKQRIPTNRPPCG